MRVSCWLLCLKLQFHVVTRFKHSFALFSVSYNTVLSILPVLESVGNILNCSRVCWHDGSITALRRLGAFVLKLMKMVLVPQVIEGTVRVAYSLPVRAIERCDLRLVLATVL